MTENAKRWKQVPWFRVGAEAIAVIASILIAFAIDAAWDQRQDNLDLKTDLAALAAEIDAARLDLL